MKMIKECLHCGREYHNTNSGDFCSFKCASEVS